MRNCDNYLKIGIYLIPLSDDGHFIPPTVEGKYYKSLRRVHNSLVGTVIFQTNKRNELFSGGFDCNCGVWDVDLGRPIKSVTLQAEDGYENNTQTLNPPFLHSLALVRDGKYLVAGVGDGSVRLFYINLSIDLTHRMLIISDSTF
jgi:WD40 repeat protein